MNQAIHICIDFMVLGSVEYVRAHGEEFVSATVAIMQSSDEPDIYRRLVVARAINVLLPVVRAEVPRGNGRENTQYKVQQCAQRISYRHNYP